MKTLTKSLLALTVGLGSFNAFATDSQFDVELTLLEPVTVSEVSSLDFGAHVGGTYQNITIAPADGGAAVFNASGSANQPVSLEVLEDSIDLITGDGATADKMITVDNFKFNLTSPSFDGNGDLDNIRIGADAEIQAGDIGGEYAGKATLRVTYL